MHSLDHYTREMKDVARKATQNSRIGGSHVAWLMMITAALFTGTFTYSTTHQGMKYAAVWKAWADIAAFLPVVLLEVSALTMTYGRHYWFRAARQRQEAETIGWLIWGLLTLTTVFHFASATAASDTMRAIVTFYGAYVLPVAALCAGVAWKRLYDTAPESEMRAAVLDAEADLKSELVSIQREQNRLMIEAYREALQTTRVSQARAALFEQASIEHAKGIVGFIEGADRQPVQTPAQTDASEPKKPVTWAAPVKSSGRANGVADWPGDDAGKA